MTTKKLTPRQARWAEFLSEFNFKVTYQTGKKNDKADALTRKPNERPISNQGDQQEHRMQVLLPPERIEIQPIEITNKPDEESVEAKPEEGTKATSDKNVEAKHDKHNETEAEGHEEAEREATPAEPLAKPRTKPKEKAEESEELKRLHAAEPHAEPKESVDKNEKSNEKLTEDLPSLPD